MALTQAQLQTLKTDILANTDPEVIAALAAGSNNAIADWYNQLASPSYWLYRSGVSAEELSNAINLQNMADITAADSDRVMKLFNLRTFNGGEFHGDVESDRTAWDDVFSAAAGDESQQAIAALWQRTGTYAEQVFSLGTGTGADAANADTTSFQGLLSSNDVIAALNS